MTPTPVRFHDPRATLADFASSILVRCPRCERIAHFGRGPCTTADGEGGRCRESRVICRSCGLCRIDMHRYFRPPLWLQTETRHGHLWAYNLEHLDPIRRFVAADLRERAPWYDTGQKMTLVARLPAWMKSAKNRDEILRAVDRLRATVIAPG
ncbi:hypothetical protein OG496_46780 [Streptomyces sp. NBC_00988]|uniref:hypothetical protein n=1 Tax=Streptomyces sp. NBC_00988 TaxID=2903704 RepID=UPI00386E2B37|nr:hypothetical protein OG496_46780 [Streptomyces sp. NBC_00988]